MIHRSLLNIVFISSVRRSEKRRVSSVFQGMLNEKKTKEKESLSDKAIWLSSNKIVHPGLEFLQYLLILDGG